MSRLIQRNSFVEWVICPALKSWTVLRGSINYLTEWTFFHQLHFFTRGSWQTPRRRRHRNQLANFLGHSWAPAHSSLRTADQKCWPLFHRGWRCQINGRFYRLAPTTGLLAIFHCCWFHRTIEKEICARRGNMLMPKLNRHFIFPISNALLRTSKAYSPSSPIFNARWDQYFYSNVLKAFSTWNTPLLTQWRTLHNLSNSLRAQMEKNQFNAMDERHC